MSLLDGIRLKGVLSDPTEGGFRLGTKLPESSGFRVLLSFDPVRVRTSTVTVPSGSSCECVCRSAVTHQRRRGDFGWGWSAGWTRLGGDEWRPEERSRTRARRGGVWQRQNGQG